MTIVFNSVIPFPLSESDLSQSSVWEKDFTIENGKNYLINASSGKGKSTFVNILFGLRHDYSGTVLIDNRPIRDLSMKGWSELRTLQLASVFQSLDLFPDHTVLENIFIKNRLTDYKTEGEIRNLLEKLEIDRLAESLAGNLSMGQQQRVAIARSLCQPFNWVLLDEPFSHLDDKNIQNAWELIETELKAQSANAIITSLGQHHNINPLQTLML